MSKTNQQKSSFKFFTLVVIGVALVLGWVFYKFVLGNPGNFVDGNPAGEPKQGNMLAIMYKGGFIVPILTASLLTVLIVIIERAITVFKVQGKGNTDTFVRTVKGLLDKNDIAGAMTACDKQQGSVANVVRSGLERYKQMEGETTMSRDQKVMAIQKELEEATTLELPMLEKNLIILATVSSIATLLGLFGTVLGMIRAFAALANAGSPDTSALSSGISEALVNTALGIGTSFLAIIAYNTFTTIIDGITYRIDEAGFSIAQTYVEKHPA